MEVGSQPPGRLQALEGRKNRGERIDLEKIFAYKRGSGNPAPGDLYPIAWASVHYLNADPKRQKQLVAMVEAQANGVDWKTAYSKAFSQSIEDLSQKVEAHAEMLNRGVPGAVLYIPLDELEVRTDWTVRSLEPIEVLRLFGEFAVSGLIAHSKEYNRVLARTLLNRALEFSPNDSRIHAGLASTAAQESDFETADLHLARFAADSNPSATAIVHAAFARALYAESLSKDDQAEERKAAHQAAITLYQRALEREPENAFALAGLGRGWLATEAFDRAREPLARAQSLGEWDAELTLDRALVEKELGFSEEARRLWLEVVRLGSPEQAKKAAALIKLESLHAGVSSGEENK